MNLPASKSFYETLFADVSRAGVYRLPHTDNTAMEAGAGAAGCCVFHVDFARARNKDEMLLAIGKALAFPEWFGANWDALADCLSDMGWRPALGYVVVLDHCDLLHLRAETDLAYLLKVFQEAAEQWREDAVPFWCLISMDTDSMLQLPTLDRPA